jgi:hypothetical protein
MASGVEMSGVGAPARTAKPEVARPISVREPATSDPSFSITFHHGRREDQDVGPLACLQPVLNEAHSIENAFDLVAGFVRKCRDEFLNRAFDRAGAHHLELGGASRRRGEHQSDRAMTLATPCTASAQGLYFNGPGVSFGVGAPWYRHRYYDPYYYDPYAYGYYRPYWRYRHHYRWHHWD